MPSQVPRGKGLGSVLKKRRKQFYKSKNTSYMPEMLPSPPSLPPSPPPPSPSPPPSSPSPPPPYAPFADVDKARMLSLPQRMPSTRYSTIDNGAGVKTPQTRARFTPQTRARFTPRGRASFTETTKDRFFASPPPYASLGGGQMSNNMQRKTKRIRNKNTNRIRNKYTNRRRNNSIRLH